MYELGYCGEYVLSGQQMSGSWDLVSCPVQDQREVSQSGSTYMVNSFVDRSVWLGSASRQCLYEGLPLWRDVHYII